MKLKVGKTESRVQVITDCLQEAERAAAGDVTESASVFMIFINIIGSGPADQKIQDKIIESLCDDPDATDVPALKKMIQDIEEEVLIKGGNSPNLIIRMNQSYSQPNEAGTVSRKDTHCQICNGSYHLAQKC